MKERNNKRKNERKNERKEKKERESALDLPKQLMYP